eukprot:TRINITY_DN1033_c0_g1_i2.p1 TRINITY_DN1033_c0_g1~~TRINITY_DN1033_c0_g1_i2.p1  ORF type:complete len:223 (+),score=55.65 TRINITY_DN1033_c0_g1_i2:59-727(+)
MAILSKIVAGLVAFAALAQGAVVNPQPWPNQFTGIQVQYQPQFGDVKQVSLWHYDFNNNPPRHRFDHHVVRGHMPGLPKNNSEWWIGTDLYMYDWDLKTCQHLDMGFGIPRPDWFLTNSTNTGTQWLQHEDRYYQTVQLSKPAPTPYPPFNYYAFASNGTAFRLEAPGPVGEIYVNDFYNVVAEPQPDELFQLPAGVVCQNSTFAQAKLSWSHFLGKLLKTE